MKIIDLPPMELRKRGIRALAKELGAVGMVRFLHQFEWGDGNYTEERKEWLEYSDMEGLIAELKSMRQDTDS